MTTALGDIRAAGNMQKPSGDMDDFKIESVTYHPEAGFVLSYKDADHDFYFYITYHKPKTPSAFLEVQHATNGRLSGLTVSLPSSEVSRIEANIRSHFSKYDLDDRPTSDPAMPVVFSWRISNDHAH
jgi:hypothetical protein